MSFRQAREAFEAAAAAMALEDYTTAINQCLRGQALLAAVPDSERSGDRLQFGRELDGLLNSCRERERTLGIRKNGGVQTSKVFYRAAGDRRGPPWGY